MEGASTFLIAIVISILVNNLESAPVDPKKSTEKPADANVVGDGAAGVSNSLQTELSL